MTFITGHKASAEKPKASMTEFSTDVFNGKKGVVVGGKEENNGK